MNEERDEEQEQQEQPPKIKLGNGNGNGIKKPDLPDEVVAPTDDSEAPPKLHIPAAAAMNETVRVELPDATGFDAKKATAKVDLSEVKTPGPMVPPVGTPTDAKKETSRIDIPEAEMASLPGAETKKKTTPIDESEAPAEEVAEEPVNETYETAKRATMRIELEEEGQDEGADEEATLAAPPADAEPSDKHKTSRIDLSEVLGDTKEPDVFKRRTAGAAAAPAAGPGSPKTIRIRKPGTAPTRVLKKPPIESAAEAAEAQETVSDSGKSATARIDLPPDAAAAPPTQRKTIRIKRPDTAAAPRPTMAVSRPAEKPKRKPKAPPTPMEGPRVAEAPGGAFAVVALAAAIVSAVVFYVLAAQTIAPNLPFPGPIS